MDPTDSQFTFPAQRKTAPTISPADLRRAMTAACVITAAALRRFRTAAQTAPRNSDLLALFNVFLPRNCSAMRSAGVASRLIAIDDTGTQKPLATTRRTQEINS